jgi:hypothetical protein
MVPKTPALSEISQMGKRLAAVCVSVEKLKPSELEQVEELLAALGYPTAHHAEENLKASAVEMREGRS